MTTKQHDATTTMKSWAVIIANQRNAIAIWLYDIGKKLIICPIALE